MAHIPQLESSPVSFVKRWWWVFGFLALCAAGYTLAVQKKKTEIVGLKHRVQELEVQKTTALQEREDLVRQIESQSDPAWIELILMKGLGLVPEGHKKVYFYKEEAERTAP